MRIHLKDYLLGVLLITILITSCNSLSSQNSTETLDKKNTNPIINTDSIEITKLIRKAYEWHETKYRRNGYPFKFNSTSDSIFTGVDWDEYAKDMEVYKKTNFFSNDFFIENRKIAVRIDSSINQTSAEWRNKNDGISIWDTGAGDWCNCQDNPDKYWNSLMLKTIKLKNEKATFYWAWDDQTESPSNKYEMKAEKENGVWKISYMDYFKYYGTVESYNQVMKSNK